MSEEREILISLNGQRADSVSALDRGLHYGDGVFRTLRVCDGRPVWWQDQLDRLVADCVAIGIHSGIHSGIRGGVMGLDTEALCQEAFALAGEPGVGVLKIVVTRGQGRRGYAFSPDMAPTRLLLAYPFVPWHPHGVRARWCDLRLSAQTRLAGIKHLNRLENVLARSEWSDPDIAEGLLMNEADEVISGTMSNVFLLEGDRLVTPDLSRCGVAGVARQRLLRGAARAGATSGVETVSRERLLAADAVFLSNSLIGVRQIGVLENRVWTDFGQLPKLVNWLNENN